MFIENRTSYNGFNLLWEGERDAGYTLQGKEGAQLSNSNSPSYNSYLSYSKESQGWDHIILGGCGISFIFPLLETMENWLDPGCPTDSPQATWNLGEVTVWSPCSHLVTPSIALAAADTRVSRLPCPPFSFLLLLPAPVAGHAAVQPTGPGESAAWYSSLAEVEGTHSAAKRCSHIH